MKKLPFTTPTMKKLSLESSLSSVEKNFDDENSSQELSLESLSEIAGGISRNAFGTVTWDTDWGFPGM